MKQSSAFRCRPRHFLALTALLVSPLLAQLAMAKGFPYGENLVTPQGGSVVSLAKDGSTQWQATFGASGPLEITPDSKAPWLASGSQLWAFDPAAGTVTWQERTGGAQAFTPKALKAGWLVSWKEKDSWIVAVLAKSDGQKLWSQSCSEKPAFLSDDDLSPLILESGSQLFAFSQEDAKPVWTAQVEHDKHWLSADKLVLYNGKELQCLRRGTGQSLWRFPCLAPPLSARETFPTGVKASLGPNFLVEVQNDVNDELGCLDLETGKILWHISNALTLRTFSAWAGDRVVHRLGEDLEFLDGKTGQRLKVFHLNSYQTNAYLWKGQILTVGRSSFPKKMLDANGNPQIDPKTHKVLKKNEDTFALFVEDKLLATYAKSGTSLTFVGDSLVYSSHTQATLLPGQNVNTEGDVKTFPLLLHGQSGPGEPPWEWVSDTDASWRVVDGHVIVLFADGSLSEIDRKDGKVIWRSPALVEKDAKFPDLQWIGPSVWVETGKGHVTCLDTQGKIAARWDLEPAFNSQKRLHLFCLILLSSAIGYYIAVARKRKLFIRKIAGLEAIDEAVGRATEMGRPVLYVPGLEDIDMIQTLASLSILSHVAKKTADYDTDILVPTRKAVVMSTAQEVVKESYTLAGRPDAYNADNIRYLTDDQFGFVAGVDGIMLREKPAANFYLGMFYGESLILAETGFATGAIQIAGTAAPSQLPFFVATCDYTLMGEELYAASAYLSEDPLQIGSLRGQDVGKAFVMGWILAGTLAHSFGMSVALGGLL